jgi:hypothetical protein
MKCAKHDECYAIGTCAYCGSGICGDCSIRVQEVLHCKDCLSEGRILGTQPYQYEHPYLDPRLLQQPFPKKETCLEFSPKGTPDKALFKFGELGGYSSSIMCILVVCAILFHPESDFEYASAYVALFVLFITVLFLSSGVRGIYWNYGAKRTELAFWILLFSSIMGCIAVATSLWKGFEIYSNFRVQIPNTWVETAGLFLGFLMFCISIIICVFAINEAKKYLRENSRARKTLVGAMGLLSCSSVPLMVLILVLTFRFINNNMIPYEISQLEAVGTTALLCISLIIISVGLLFVGFFFHDAPMPEGKYGVFRRNYITCQSIKPINT